MTLTGSELLLVVLGGSVLTLGSSGWFWKVLGRSISHVAQLNQSLPKSRSHDTSPLNDISTLQEGGAWGLWEGSWH